MLPTTCVITSPNSPAELTASTHASFKVTKVLSLVSRVARRPAMCSSGCGCCRLLDGDEEAKFELLMSEAIVCVGRTRMCSTRNWGMTNLNVKMLFKVSFLLKLTNFEIYAPRTPITPKSPVYLSPTLWSIFQSPPSPIYHTPQPSSKIDQTLHLQSNIAPHQSCEHY